MQLCVKTQIKNPTLILWKYILIILNILTFRSSNEESDRKLERSLGETHNGFRHRHLHTDWHEKSNWRSWWRPIHVLYDAGQIWRHESDKVDAGMCKSSRRIRLLRDEKCSSQFKGIKWVCGSITFALCMLLYPRTLHLWEIWLDDGILSHPLRSCGHFQNTLTKIACRIQT